MTDFAMMNALLFQTPVHPFYRSEFYDARQENLENWSKQWHKGVFSFLARQAPSGASNLNDLD